MIELINKDSYIFPESDNLAEYKGQENILVISPHPDDDAIGLGGTIKKYANDDRNVFVAYVTTGSGTPAAGRRGKATIVKQRQDEAISALKTLGGRAGFFLHYESVDVLEKRIDDVVQDLFSIIIFLQPKVIFVPSPFEYHPTHLACTARALQAIAKVPPYELNLRGYSVWGPLFADEAEIEKVDITETIDAKKRAIRAHASELKFRDYDIAETSKNHYDAVFEDPHKPTGAEYVEEFLIMDELATRPELELNVYARNLALKKLRDMYEGLILSNIEDDEI